METLQRTANRGSISTGFDIDNSIKLEESNNEDLVTTNQAAGNQKTWTFSVWAKRTQLGYNSATIFGAGNTRIRFYSDDRLGFDMYDGTSYDLITTQKFRDTSAWYHIVVILDTTQATASERARLYVNGERITVFDTETYPTQNANLDVGGQGSSSNWLQFGRFYSGGLHYSGYLAEAHYLNGTVAEPTEFGEYDSDSGIWIPKEYTGGGYGTQGFYYKFDNASNLGEDSSGEGHDANSLGNVTSANQATDTPTNNFATWQVLTGQPYAVIRNGATHYNLSGQVGWYSNVGSIAFTKGKWYAEFRLGSGITNMMAGVSQVDSEQSWNNTHLGGVSNSTAYNMGFYNANGNVYTNNGSTAWGSSFPAGTVIMVAVDYKTSGVVSLYFGTNGTWANSSNPETGANNFDMNSGSPLPNNLAISFAASPYNNGGNAEANFGGFSGFSIASGNTDESGYGTFEYAPPSGYYALCTKNLAEYG